MYTNVKTPKRKLGSFVQRYSFKFWAQVVSRSLPEPRRILFKSSKRLLKKKLLLTIDLKKKLISKVKKWWKYIMNYKRIIIIIIIYFLHILVWMETPGPHEPPLCGHEPPKFARQTEPPLCRNEHAQYIKMCLSNTGFF